MSPKVVIRPIFADKGSPDMFYFLFSKKKVLQGEAFKIGFEVENSGDKPIPRLVLEEICINSAHGQDISHLVNGSFFVDALNPREKRRLWVDVMGTYMHGLACVRLRVRIDGVAEQIETYQQDSMSGVVSKCRESGRWIDFFYIASKAESFQEKSNVAFLFFAAATFILGVSPIVKTFMEEHYESKRLNELREVCLSDSDYTRVKVTEGQTEKWVSCDDIKTLEPDL